MGKAALGVGLLGLGTVGGSVAELLARHASAHEAKVGRPVRVVAAAVRRLEALRPWAPDFLTDDPLAVVAHPEVEVVVELMGGADAPLAAVRAALQAKKPVVTANKALLAKHGAELAALAQAQGVPLLAEAAVAGGIPIMLPLMQGLAGNRLRRVAGIVNGTTNFILSAMAEGGAELSDALAEAQRLGFAEADPSADLEGHDAAAKLVLLAAAAFGVRLEVEGLPRTGLGAVGAADLRYAKELGHAIKLLAIAERAPDGRLWAGVHPALVPLSHPIAGVGGVLNAVAVEGDAVGEVMLSGPGAGGMPTASSVVGDLLSIAALPLPHPLSALAMDQPAELADPKARPVRGYWRLHAEDRPGVLATVGQVCGEAGVSIQSMLQHAYAADGAAEIVLITHAATEGSLAAAHQGFLARPELLKVVSFLRVEALHPAAAQGAHP